MHRGDAGDTFVLISLRDAAAFIIRGLPLAIAFSAVGILAVWMLNQQRPDSFTAVAYLLSVRQDQAPTVVRGLVPGSLDPALYRAAVANGTVLDAVRSNWTSFTPLPEDSQILSRLRVVSDNQLQSSVIRVEYRAENPGDAAAVATAVAQELVAWDQARTLRPLESWRERLQAELGDLEVQIARSAAPGPELLQTRDQRFADLAELQSTLPLSQLSLLSEAEAPVNRDGRGLVTGAALAIAVGVILAYLLRLIMLVLRSKAKQAEPLARTSLPESA